MASNMLPNYEVKLLMEPSAVLRPNNELRNTVESAFGITSVQQINVQFLDTDTKDLSNAGWTLRVRKMEDEGNFELTYKKRYLIRDGSGGNIDDALTIAKNDGFDSTTAYKAQVELGYQRQTLSISKDMSDSDSDFSGMDLPDKATSRKILTKNAPGKFNWSNENWGTEMLAVSRIYGPVHAKRSKGEWNDMRLYIEVWPIQKSNASTDMEYIVEASFKTSSLTAASMQRNRLVAFLESKDWLLAQDFSKTSLIIDRY